MEVRRLLNKDVPYGQERAELVAKLKADRDAGLQQIDAEGSEEADHSVSESMAQQLEDLKVCAWSRIARRGRVHLFAKHVGIGWVPRSGSVRCLSLLNPGGGPA